MAKEGGNPLNDVLQDEAGLLQSWVEGQVNAPGFRADRTSREEVAEQSRRFLSLFADASKTGVTDIRATAWSDVRPMLDDVSSARARQGFSPSETATFIFSLKQPLFERLRVAAGTIPNAPSRRRGRQARSWTSSASTRRRCSSAAGTGSSSGSSRN